MLFFLFSIDRGQNKILVKLEILNFKNYQMTEYLSYLQATSKIDSLLLKGT